MDLNVCRFRTGVQQATRLDAAPAGSQACASLDARGYGRAGSTRRKAPTGRLHSKPFPISASLEKIFRVVRSPEETICRECAGTGLQQVSPRFPGRAAGQGENHERT